MTTSTILDENQGLLRTRLAWVQDLCDPVATPPWWTDQAALTLTEILAAEPCSVHPVIRAEDPLDRDACTVCDLASIHHFYQHPDPHDPITIDVGIFNYWPDWYVTDGNHRLAAAILRGDEWVTALIHGDWNRGVDLFVHGHTHDTIPT